MALVDIKRGTDQIIPDYHTRLCAGDYVYIVTDSVYAAETVRDLVECENA